MNKILFLIFCCQLFVIRTTAQCVEFDDLLSKGDKYLKLSAPNYQEAINTYTAAILACPNRAHEAKQRISKMVIEINKLKENAIISEKKADDARKIVQSLYNESEKVKSELLKERDRISSLNEFIRYNNKQFFQALYVKNSEMIDLKASEFELYNKQKIDTIDKDYYFWALHLLSSLSEQIGNLDDALLYANTLCKLFDYTYISYERRSIVHYYRSEWKAALANIDTLFTLNPDSSTLSTNYLNGSLILSYMGRYNEANVWADSTIKYRLREPEDQILEDIHLSSHISEVTGLYSLYLSRDYSIKVVELYKILNDIYSLKGNVENLIGFEKQKIPTSVILTLINYVSLHLDAIPDDYIGSLINGYLWELGGYDEVAKKNYKEFLHQHAIKRRGECDNYFNNFKSKIYNEMKKT